jgi:hypothetical protein
MENPFEPGQIVICDSENFPVIKEYGGADEEATAKPRKGEELIVDEILGEFVRFDKYDTEESFNWWKHDRFSPLDDAMANEDEIASEELIYSLVN